MSTTVGRSVASKAIIPSIADIKTSLPFLLESWGLNFQKAGLGHAVTITGEIQVPLFAKTLGCCPFVGVLVILRPMKTLNIFAHLENGIAASSQTCHLLFSGVL